MHRSWGTRALVLAAGVTTAMVGLVSTSSSAQGQSAPASHQWLVVADDVAGQVTVVDATTGAITGGLGGIRFGTHAGTVQLGNGRIAFMDESKPQLDVVQIGTTGLPEITAHYPIPDPDGRWERAGWLATDTSRRYLAVGSDFDGSTTQQVTLIDRRTGRSRTAQLPVSQVSVPTGTGTEELETFLVGEPLRLVVSAGGHLDAYSVADILGGSSRPRIVASTPLSAYPHGPIVNNGGTVIGTTVALGQQTVQVTTAGFGAASFALYPKASLQSYRPVMAPGGTIAVGTQAGKTAAGTSWDKVPAYLTTGSTASAKLTSVALGNGNFTRTVATKYYAATVLTGATGDKLVIVPRNAATGYYDGRPIGLPLTRLQNGPVAGQPTTGKAVRFLAATADGSHVFVGRGQEGTVTELSAPGTSSVVQRTISLPTPLSDGGYLTTVDSTLAPYDLSGR